MTLEDCKKLLRWLAGCMLVGYGFAWLLGFTPLGRDDSDPGRWGERSGMQPRTDHATGCQYLAVPGGGITPRLTADGQHMGCRR